MFSAKSQTEKKKSEFTAASPQRSTSAFHLNIPPKHSTPASHLSILPQQSTSASNLSIPVGAILSQYSVKSTSPQHSLFSTLPTVASPQHLTSAFLSEPSNISALTLSSQHSNSLHSHTKPYYTNKTISALLLSSQHSTLHTNTLSLSTCQRLLLSTHTLYKPCYKSTHTYHVIKAHTHTYHVIKAALASLASWIPAFQANTGAHLPAWYKHMLL